MENTPSQHNPDQSIELKYLQSKIETLEKSLAKAHEQLLKEIHHELHQFIQINQIPMVLWRGADHVYTIVNEAHDKMLGKAVLGKTIREAHTPEEAKNVPQILDKIYESGRPFISIETFYLIFAEDGQTHPKWINEWFYPFYNLAGDIVGILGAAQEVTEQVLARQTITQKKTELQETILQLEHEREAREQFVATLSHDLRTPLTAAKLGAQVIARKAEDATSVRKLAAKIEDSVDRSDKMIRDLLDANRIKAGEKLSIDLSPCNLAELTRHTIIDLATIHRDRFYLDIPNSQIFSGFDFSAYQRILENLINNAVKYGSFDRKIKITLFQEGEVISLSIHNWGSIISVEDQATLFNQHRRTNSAQKSLVKGWGLGLTLVKGLIEAHGGSISVESSHASGTTFKVRFIRI